MANPLSVEPAIENIPPHPILGDFVRDKAREREKRDAKKRFFSIRIGNPPPAEPLPPPDPQNPWRVLAETVFVDATIVRPIKPLRPVKGVGVAGRSRFRKGVMTLDADGFTLTGIGVAPVLWFGRAGCLGYAVCAFLFVGAQWLSVSNDFLSWIGGIAFCVGVLGYILESIVTEARRGPQEIRVFWDNVLEAQFEPGMRWAVIVYRAPEPKPGAPTPIAQLPLNNLTPSVAGALWDAIDTYAPGRTRPDGGAYVWTTGRKLFALLLAGTITGCIILIVWNIVKP